MTEPTPFKIMEASEEPEYPSPSKPGRILFVRYLDETYDDFEVLDHDCDSACFWAAEGVGLNYLLEDIISLPTEPGHFIVHGVTVDFIRGDGWYTDDDDRWNWKRIEKLSAPITELPEIEEEN